jgi:integrase
MAAITERNGRYQVRIRRDGFRTVTKSFHLKRDAVAFGRRVEADMEAGRWREDTAGAAPTFSEALQQYRQEVVPRFRDADTYRWSYEAMSLEPFAAKPIDEVSSRDVAAWRDRLAEGRKPGTVVRQLALLSAVFTWAVKEQGWCADNPVQKVRRPRVVDSRSRTLTAEEMDWLTSTVQDEPAWLGSAFIVLARSAMRRGELFSVRLADVDASASKLRLHETKNGRARDVPLDPVALAAVCVLMAGAVARGDDRLIPLGAVGSISTAFSRLVKRAQARYEQACLCRGVEPVAGFLADLRLHDLRHHAVTLWASTGSLSVMELMQISGHLSPRLLARYTHLSATSLAAKMGNLVI